MTQRPDNPADPFKKALAEATRTMADAPEPTSPIRSVRPGLRHPNARP
jgi:cobaltochelatase CobT